ncbi:UNVERIFIED_CONTAM: hypothetical protein Sindi_2570300 [Sesamum indicum]
MHIGKNVFDNIFNTVMDIKEKTKDNLNTWKDIKIICNQLELEVDNRRPNMMPKSVYTLTKEQKRRLCEWISHLKFPNGYASNLAHCIDMKQLRLHVMKSHDCHALMQKSILIAFREILPKPMWSALTDVSLLFQILSLTTLDIDKVQVLRLVSPVLYNLKNIFPPAFFDSIEHLIIHLPYEVRVGGPIQYSSSFITNKYSVIEFMHQHFWFGSIKMTFWWDCDDESCFGSSHVGRQVHGKDTFHLPIQHGQATLVGQRGWLQLQAYWASKDFQQESSKNKANQVTNPTASSIVSRKRGSSFIGIHKRKLSSIGHPKQMELFGRFYKKKEDGDLSEPRVMEVAEMFQKLLEDRQPQPMTEDHDAPAESEASMAMNGAANVVVCSRGQE